MTCLIHRIRGCRGEFSSLPYCTPSGLNVKGIVTHYGVGYHFHLGMSLRDLKLLENIMQILGNKGKIYIYLFRKGQKG